MVRKRVAVRKRDNDSTAEERVLLPQLFELLRSSALASLLPSKSTASTSVSATAQAALAQCHKSVPFPVQEDGWQQQKPKKAKKAFPTELISEKLDPDGWSVPVRSSISELRMGTPGVCLASVDEAKRVMQELKADQPTAVLVPTNFNGAGVETSVFTTDKNGRAQTRVRYMFQLAQAPVVFRSSVPVVATKPDCTKIVLMLYRAHMENAKWEFASKNCQSAARLWMKERLNVEALDVRPPTRPSGDTESMQVIAYIPKISVEALLKSSSLDGVFTREFYESDVDRQRYKVVMLPQSSTIEAAQRQAAWMAAIAMGIVSTQRGFAIRVPADQYETAVKMLYPTDCDRFLGKRWEVSGLPLSMGRSALIEFLDTWRVIPEYTFRQGVRRTWIVRATTLPHITKVQHDQGLAVVKEAQPRPPTTQPVEKFVKPTEPRSAPPASRKVTPPQSWSSIVKGAPPLEQSRASAVQKPQASAQSAGIESVITAAIAAALRPYQDEMQKLQSSILVLQQAQSEFASMEFEMQDGEDGEESDLDVISTAATAQPAAVTGERVAKKPKIIGRRLKISK